MASAQLAREVLAAPPAERPRVFNAVVEAAKSEGKCDYTKLYREEPWLALALTHQSLLALGFKPEKIEHFAFELILLEPLIGLLAVELDILGPLADDLDPGTDPRRPELFLRLGDDWQSATVPNPDEQLQRSQEFYERALRHSMVRPVTRARAANNLAKLLCTRADPRDQHNAIAYLAVAIERAKESTGWFAEASSLEDSTDPPGECEAAYPELTAAGIHQKLAEVELVWAEHRRGDPARAQKHLTEMRMHLRRAAGFLKEARGRLRQAVSAAQHSMPESFDSALADSIRQQVRRLEFLWRESCGDAKWTEAKLADDPTERARLQGLAVRLYSSALGLGSAAGEDAAASVAQKRADLRSDLAKPQATSSNRHAQDRVDDLKRIGAELRNLDRPEQAAGVYHDLGVALDDLSDARRSSLAYRRASRLLDKLAQGDPSGPSWVARISRLAEIEDRLLAALARGRPPVAPIARMARSFGRDADDALVQRWRRPNGLDGVTLNEQDELKFAKVLRSIGRRSDDIYEKYLVLEHRIRKLEGLELGAGDKRGRDGKRDGKEKPRKKNDDKANNNTENGDKWFSRFAPGLRTLRRQAGELATELRRRFNSADRSWSPTAHPLRANGLRALAMRAASAVVSLHPAPDGIVAGVILPDGQFRAKVLPQRAGNGSPRPRLTSARILELMLGRGGWRDQYEFYRNTHRNQKDEKLIRWECFQDGAKTILDELGEKLWQPLVQWLDEECGYSPAKWPCDPSDPKWLPPPLVLIPAGPGLDVLPLSAMSYAGPNGPRVAADDYRIVHAPTFRLLEACLDRRDRRGTATRRCLSVTGTPKADKLIWPDIVQEKLVELYSKRITCLRDATISAVREQINRHDIVSFKGHGVYNAGAPLRSRIILAEGSLFLKDAAGMDLGDVEYLEALGCETMLGAWNNRVSAMASFAGHFLSAGVGGAVGSIWCQTDSYIWSIHSNWLHEELAGCVGPLTPGLALWRATARLRTASNQELENSLLDLTKNLGVQEQAAALEQFYDDQDDHAAEGDGPLLRLPRNWAGLIAYGPG